MEIIFLDWVEIPYKFQNATNWCKCLMPPLFLAWVNCPRIVVSHECSRRGDLRARSGRSKRWARVDEEDDGKMWDHASLIRCLAKKILSLLPGVQEAEGAEVQEPPANSNARRDFRMDSPKCYWHCLEKDNEPAWRLGSCSSKHDFCHQKGWRFVGATTATATWNCQLPMSRLSSPATRSHLIQAAALAGSAIAVTWSQGQVETMSRGQADALDLLEQSAGGAMEAETQQLEHSLLELQNQHRGQDHPYTASTLVLQDHPDIAHTLRALLGLLSRQAGDLPAARQHLEESLRMERSMHGDSRSSPALPPHFVH